MGVLKMEDKKIVEMIESIERLGNWTGEKIVELSNRPLVVTGVSVAVASLVSWKLSKCLTEDKLEEPEDEISEEKLEEIIPKQSAATEQKEESLSPEDKWNKHTEEFCKKQSIPSFHSYYNPRMEESYAERGWQTQRDPVNRSTRSSTTAQPVATKRAPIRKTPRRPSPAKMSTSSSLRSPSPTKSSSKKLTPKTTPRKSNRKPYGDFVF